MAKNVKLTQKQLDELCSQLSQARLREVEAKNERLRITSIIIDYVEKEMPNNPLTLKGISVHRAECYKPVSLNKDTLNKTLVKKITDVGIDVSIKPPHPNRRTSACKTLLEKIEYKEQAVTTTYVKFAKPQK